MTKISRRRFILGALAGLVAGASLVASAEAAVSSRRGPNIVLVSFDALQAAHVGCLGSHRDTTPTIDALARKGALFQRAISAAPWTLPSHMSWFTGTYPSLHKVVNKYTVYRDTEIVVTNLQKLSPGMETLAQVLKSNGYATGGFTGDAGVNGMFGYSAGFDVYSDSVPPFSGFETSIPKALSWVSEVKERRFFLFLHGYGIHGQYQPPGGYDRRFVDPKYPGSSKGTPAEQRDLREAGLRGDVELSPQDVEFWRALYDEKIARADAQFAGFMAAMEKMGALENTILVIASDHGTEFYEHHKFDHGHTLYDELIRVPLIIVLPGSKKGVVVSQQVTMLDLMPTLLDLAGIKVSDALKRQMLGRSLAASLRSGKFQAEDAYIETDYRLYTQKRGLRTADGWKFIVTMETGKKELYDLRTDPGETVNLVQAQPRKAYELEQRLFGHYKSLGIDLDETKWTAGCLPVYADQCH